MEGRLIRTKKQNVCVILT